MDNLNYWDFCYTNEILFYLDEVMVKEDGSVQGVRVRKFLITKNRIMIGQTVVHSTAKVIGQS